MVNYPGHYSTKRLKLDRHPIKWVMRSLGAALNNCNLVFSNYVYIPQSYSDERFIFEVPFHHLNDDALYSFLTRLSPRQDLALHSTICVDGNVLHIPMIDFGGRNQKTLNLKSLHALQSHWSMEFAIYNSGRSFHAYGDRLLPEDEWIKFMGSLLLLNEPGASRILDTRWVGHRLLAGYSALRWSCNTRQYKRYPAFVGMLSELMDIE